MKTGVTPLSILTVNFDIRST